MIGFEEEPASERGHPNEDPDTQESHKKELFTMLSHRFYLPPFHSRGITRDYLLRVHKERVFRVPMLELKHFEVELTTGMTKRVGIFNNCLLVRKVNLLLASRGAPELGFDEFDPPEEVILVDKSWLYRVTRFIDQSNILEFFESPVVTEKAVTSSSSLIQQVHWGRHKASKYFFRIQEAKSDRKLWESFKALSTSYRAYLWQQLLVDKMRRELDQATKRTFDLGRTLDDQISKIAFTYTTIENPQVRPEMIIHGSEQVTQEIRDRIMLNCKL